MNQEFVLGKLAEIMRWGTDRAREEFAWLRLMSRIKYDGYQDFVAGKRFVESLAAWLQQFAAEDRDAAYHFARERLVYVGPSEMEHLVELLYPETVQWRLMEAVADECEIPMYRVWSNSEATKCYNRLLRKTLFIELSDGARIDIFRRANAGRISNEQIVTSPRIIEAKWHELLNKLRKDSKDETAQFRFVFLVDDFVGSGTTLLRNEGGEWQGKLRRFWDDVQKVLSTHFEQDWVLCVHHYLGSHRAQTVVSERQKSALTDRGNDNWFQNVKFSFGMVLPEHLPLDEQSECGFVSLIERYYDDTIETEHMKLGGHDARFGFGKCGLPVILEHNTPNNSVALLWAETLGTDGNHAMRPLFRRRQRHT